jgi:putative transposase
METKIGEIVGEIKRLSAKEIHKMLNQHNSDLIPKLTKMRNGINKFTLWQRRCYDHNCRTDSSVWEKVEYCHNNPVRRGLVCEPSQWKWSSYGCFAGERDVKIKIDVEAIAKLT